MSSAVQAPPADVDVRSAPLPSADHLGRRLRALALLPSLYALLHAVVFGGLHRAGIIGGWVESPGAYILTLVGLAAAALALGAGAAVIGGRLRDRAFVLILIAFNVASLVAGLVLLDRPLSTPSLAAPAAALALLAGTYVIGRPHLRGIVVASLVVAAVAWLGQAPCAEAACRLSGVEDEQTRYPVLVLENHNHFNVIKFRDHFYAIHQGQGAFVLEAYNAGVYPGGVDGTSLAEVLRKLDEPAGPQPASTVAPEAKPEASGSELVMSSYLSPRLGESYNVYHYADRFYAIRAAEGSFDLYYYQAGGYTDGFDGASLDEVIQQLDVPRGGPVVLAAPLEPIERYRGYVIFEFGHLFYALVEGPEGMDDEKPFSVERFWRGEYPGALDGNSLEQVHERVDARFAPATLIYSGYRGYDIWEWGGRVFGIHTADGAFEIVRYERGEYAGAVEGASIPEAVEAIEAATEGAQAGGAGN